MKAITFLTLVGIGAGAIYLFDQKKGPKRRAQLQKNLENTFETATDYWNEYSPELKKRATEFSREFGKRAGEFSRDFSEKAGVYTKDLGARAGEVSKEYATRAGELATDGHYKWSPSAR